MITSLIEFSYRAVSVLHKESEKHHNKNITSERTEVMAWYSPFTSSTDWAHSKLNNIDAFKCRWNYIKSDGCGQLQQIYVENTAAAENSDEIINETLKFLYTVDPDDIYCIIGKYGQLLIRRERHLRKIGHEPVDCNEKSDWANRIRICTAPLVLHDFMRHYQAYLNTDTFDRYAKSLAAAYAIYEDSDAIDLDYAKEILIDAAQCGMVDLMPRRDYVSPFARWLANICYGYTMSQYNFIPKFTYRMLSTIVNDDMYNSLMDFVKSKVNVSDSEIHELYTSISAYKDMKDSPDFDKRQFADVTAAVFRPDTPREDAKGAVVIIMNSLECVDPEFKDMVNAYIDCGSETFMMAPSDSTMEDELAIFEAAFLQDMEDIATEAYKPKPAVYEDEDDENDDPDKDDKKPSNPDNDKDDIPMHGSAKLGGAGINIARSSAGNKIRSKVYPLYAAYKREQGKIDAQISKIVANASKTLVGLDSDTMQRRVLGANQFSILKTLKSLILTYAVFSVSKIGGLILLITRMALRKGATKRERKKILNELENEIEIVEEKINDARGTDDREAKYALMRTKQNLETAVKKIKYAKTHYMTEGGLADSHAAINNIRGGGA